MDLRESNRALHKNAAVETPRTPLVPSGGNNDVTVSGRPRTKEVTSRYKLPARSTPSTPKRSPSPVFNRVAGGPAQTVPKRAQSAERRRPSSPASPSRPSTPVNDSSVSLQSTSKKISVGRLAEGLWPSTMRSLSVSFQSDSVSIAVPKKEKPIASSSSSRNTSITSDRTLRPTSNAGHRQAETPTVVRKPTPKKRRSPIKGRNASDQSENSKPVEAVHTRLIDQHRWPSRTGGKLSLSSLSSSLDLSDKGVRTLAPILGIGFASTRKVPSSDSGIKPLQKSSSDFVRLLQVNGSDRGESGVISPDNNVSDGLRKPTPTGISDRLTSISPAVRSQSLPSPGLRPLSPSRTSISSSSFSRGSSPARMRPSTPPSRGTSPSRIRQPSSSTQSSNQASVLTFIADIRKGKKSTGVIEDAHQLRLLHNRLLQWRFANARAENVSMNHKVTAEETLYNVLIATFDLWDCVVKKRINLQQTILELKLFSVLNGQMDMLGEWGMMESDYISSLAGCLEDLQASTLRLPVTGGARADNESLRSALCSAVDVLHAMGSSISSLLPRVEEMNSLLSELAMLSAHERATLIDCEIFLGSTAAMQVEEQSLRTHILQWKQAF